MSETLNPVSIIFLLIMMPNSVRAVLEPVDHEGLYTYGATCNLITDVFLCT